MSLRSTLRDMLVVIEEKADYATNNTELILSKMNSLESAVAKCEKSISQLINEQLSGMSDRMHQTESTVKNADEIEVSTKTNEDEVKRLDALENDNRNTNGKLDVLQESIDKIFEFMQNQSPTKKRNVKDEEPLLNTNLSTIQDFHTTMDSRMYDLGKSFIEINEKTSAIFNKVYSANYDQDKDKEPCDDKDNA
jgi:ABC-type transporter Mla subunit MlaD